MVINFLAPICSDRYGITVKLEAISTSMFRLDDSHRHDNSIFNLIQPLSHHRILSLCNTDSDLHSLVIWKIFMIGPYFQSSLLKSLP